MKLPELLSPAGNPEKLRFAVNYGADAVYCALKRFGLRAASENFTLEELESGIDYAKTAGKKVFVTLNAMPHDEEFAELDETLRSLNTIRPDGLIISDPGVLSMANELAPDIPKHLSTQANTQNAAACRFWHSQGVSRIVLARELSLEQIKRIRDNTPPELELECFVHGAMCMAYSGRCLMSAYFTGKGANEGKCTQPCRWTYELREVKRREQPFFTEEYSDGTYVFASRDLCMIEHIPELISAGISSFKIEGRVKSACYTAVVTNAYRIALDSYAGTNQSRIPTSELLAEVESVSHREYATGFFFNSPHENAQTTAAGGYIGERAFLATVDSFDINTKLARCTQRNKLCKGDTVCLLTPGRTGVSLVADELFDDGMQPIESTPHPLQSFYIRLDFAKPGDILRSAT